MAKVYNWQLGREMDYRFEQAAPDWQFAAIFNTNRCLACQTCTMSCKSTWTFSAGQEDMWWNNVETKPYGGYPQHWDVKTLGLIEDANPGAQAWSGDAGDDAPYGTYDGATIFDAARLAGTGQQAVGYIPSDEEWSAPNIHEDSPVAGAPLSDGVSLPVHETWFFYLQRICNHCSYPACLSACPRNAIYKREEDGIVLIDQERCRGYRKCVEQCPYKKSLYRADTRTSEKCIACFPRVEGSDPLTEGLPMETRCMTACPGADPAPGAGPGRRGRDLDGRPGESALLPRAGRADGATALPTVRHAAQRLLHPAALGPATVPAADVRAWRR